MVFHGISMSLDGFVAGPNQTLEEPLGQGGERLHEWIFGLAAWRRSHGESGGEENQDSQVVQEAIDRTGAVTWWGDEPPFGVPVFILTHHEREPETKQGGTTYPFVTDGKLTRVIDSPAVTHLRYRVLK
jgi:hypothetical protein